MGPRRDIAPAGARVRRRKNEKKIIIGRGVICAPRAQHGRVPKNSKNTQSSKLPLAPIPCFFIRNGFLV